MPSIILECPHCGAEKIGFTIAFQFQRSTKPGNVYNRWLTTCICSNCEDAVVVQYDNPGNAGNSSPQQCKTDPEDHGWRKTASYPKPAGNKLPLHTSEQIQRYFGQAENASKRGDWDASGAMSRKVVDVSTQQLLGSDSKNYGTIKQRIDALAQKGTITPELKEWAHQIRLGGNEAAHDEEPYTKAEAHELLDFADLYLTYVYTLPGRLNERKARAAAEKQSR